MTMHLRIVRRSLIIISMIGNVAHRMNLASSVAITVAAVLTVGTAKAKEREFSRKQLDFFESRIRPVLIEHCYECHSAASKEPRGGLRLDHREGLLVGGTSGPAIVPGKPEASLLIDSLRSRSSEMPPDGPLPEKTIRDFEEWTRIGAPDSRTIADDGDASSADKYVPVDADEWWSFQPVQVGPEPNVVDKTWPRSTVDRFILAELERHELHPVADVSANKLIRRIHLDLTGLPPSPEALKTWLARYPDTTVAGASENGDPIQIFIGELADELLATPQFGERWGRFWLDTARYAESNGNNRNRVLRYAWRYRNWVIDASNADKPYDGFLSEQIAGDLMPAESPQQRAAQRIATGFLAIGPKPYYPTIVPFDPDEPDRARFDWAAEQIDATATGMLGLTVGCARCHDHKFDPIPTRDYYALAGIFRSTNPRFGMFWDLFGVDEGQAQLNFLYDWNLLVLNDEILDKIEPLQDQYKPLVIEANRINLRKRHWPQQIERMEDKLKDEAKLSPDQVATLRSQIAERSMQLEKDAKRLVEIERQQANLKKSFTYDVDHAMGVEEGADVADVHVRLGGEHHRRGPLVPRGFLSAIDFNGAPQSINRDQSGRLELARWITHPNNPLTGRVAVNRIWYHVFGTGLVNSLDNFGSGGELPSHPRLLDHLTDKFVNEFDWSQKRLIRYLITSRIYRLDSDETLATAKHFDVDPENSLHWRTKPRRLEAEAIRDSMLAVTGTLDLDRPDGSPVVDFEYYADIRHGDRMKALDLLSGNRRTIYVPTLRGHPHKLYELFDYPDDEAVNSARTGGSVPTQMLFLMNNPLPLRYADQLVKRLETEGRRAPTDRLHRLYELCFGRVPTEAELDSDFAFLKQHESATDKRQAWSRLAHSFLISGEFLYRL